MSRNALMNILCIGGGPAGLYFALLMKQRQPAHRVTVIERNRADDTFGWGVVFSDQTLGNLHAADADSAHAIQSAFNHWDNIDIHFKGHTITSGGHGFCGIGRQRLLTILQTRARALGVELVFETEVADETALIKQYDADLVIAADGLNSRIRNQYADIFQPDIDRRHCRFVWLGTHQRFDAFTFAFEETPHGWFQAHAYQYDDKTSTFIVETPEAVWHRAGLAQMTQAEAIRYCECLFARYLGGQPLMSNARHLRGSAMWINFPRVICQTWVHRLAVGNKSVPLVLMGDAAHTAHFSIGSGTKLALEDAIELARCFDRHGAQADVAAVLTDYQRVRSVEVLKIQNAARNSTEWFENVKRYTSMEAPQFAYTLLTRSQRISHENLRLRDRAYIENYERWFAASEANILKTPAPPASQPDALKTLAPPASQPDALQTPAPPASQPDAPQTPAVPALPPMFTPYTLRGLTLKNRVVVSPMAMYSAQDGVPGEFHLVHLGARALGGAGLIFAEMTCPSREARITPGCPGLWNDAQQTAWARIVDFVHRESDARIALQLGHAGPKGSTQCGWVEADRPLAEGNWPLMAASAIPWSAHNATPRAMTEEDMARVKADFVAAAQRAAAAGFDWLELHCAHGYLLSSFICPLTNRRDDEYGGSLENRCRFPLAVFRALRAVWPMDRPMSVRISAHDWAPGGNTADDAVAIARLFQGAGCDLIDVSSGQTTEAARPIYGRMYQTPFADRIRNEVGIATMAVGAIFEADHVNSIIAAGRADLCALARPHLADAAWTLHQGARLGVSDIGWPKQYLSGKAQLERNLARERAEATASAGLNAQQVAARLLEG